MYFFRIDAVIPRYINDRGGAGGGREEGGLLVGWLAWWQAGWLAGRLAGCGDADLRVNRAHELFDLHVITESEDVAAGGDMLSAGLTAGRRI